MTGHKTIDERRKELEGMDLEGKKQLLQEIRNERIADGFDYKTKWDNDKEKSLILEGLVDGIIGKHHIKTIIETEPRPQLYYFNGGVYRPKADGIIQREIRDCLGLYATTKWVAEINGHVRGRTYTHEDEFDTEPDLISVGNGILNTQTLELREHSPAFLTRVQVPVDYNENADCPRWLKFLEEVIVPSGEECTNEYASKIDTLQEVAGYCLYRDTPFHKAIMLTGEGSNGKSVFLETLTAMLGTDNVSNVPLQAFDAREYALSAMLGKLANIHADLSDKALKQSGNFKLIVSGDGIFINQKYKDPMSTRIYAKQLFSANKVPETSDTTPAFFRRWIIIPFPNTFDIDTADKGLKSKLEEELPGILNWALAGLQRLIIDQHFSYEPSLDELELSYLTLSSPVDAFVNECMEIDSENVIPKQDLYSMFVAYAKHKKIPILSDNVFAKKLITKAQPIRATKKTIEKERVPCWTGWKVESTIQGVQDVRAKSLLLSTTGKGNIHRKNSPDRLDNPDITELDM